MMRLRRASAMALLSLLTSTATAYAECAWVLWEKRETTSPQEHSIAWDILEVYEAKATCLGGARLQVDIIAENSIERRGLGPRKIVKAIADTEVNEAYPDATTIIRHLLRCWPDSVDPRGPKPK